MKWYLKYSATFFIVITLCFICNIRSYAQEIQEFAPDSVAISLVIDTSGSMAKSDTTNLRNTSAGIFIDLLSNEDYLGVVTFDSSATEVLPLQKIENNENKKSFKDQIAPYITAKGDTNYKVALDEAAIQLKKVNDPDVRKIIIFITDGAPDPDSSRSHEESFMNQYMDTLWGSVDELVSQNIEVYSIGFSDNIRKDILSQIATKTGGDFIILPDSGLLASSSFKILSELKHRKGFLDETEVLNDTSEFSFVLDEYTTQATMVVAGKEKNDFSISVTNPEGKSANNSVSIIPGSSYTIIIANNTENMVNGIWNVSVEGNGSVDIFGDRDLNIKSWIIEPDGSSHYQTNEPVPLKVNVTGKWKQGIKVLATVLYNGNVSEDTISLEEKDGIYQGTFQMTSQPGMYSVCYDVLLNDEIVTTQSKDFTIGNVPDLNYQINLYNDGYRLGESIPIQAWLSYGTTRLKQGIDLQVNDSHLEITDLSNNESSNLALSDTDDTGLYKTKIDLNQTGEFHVDIIISGTYKNESFLVRKEIGDYTVKLPGNISVTYPEGHITNRFGEALSVPIKISSNSEFSETIRVKIDDPFVSIADNKIVIEPGSHEETIITLNLDPNIKNTVYSFSIELIPSNQMTIIEPSFFEINADVNTNTQLKINQILNNIILLKQNLTPPVLIAIIIIISLIVAFLVIGNLMYLKLYQSALIIGGKLYYAPVGSKLTDNKIFQFDSMNKKKIVISFDEKNPNADFYIKGTGFQYSLIITAGLKKSKFPIGSGWITFLTRTIPVKYKIIATEPGIIEKGDELFTNKFLLEEDHFESGGYQFCYYWPHNKWNNKSKSGSNILAEKVR